MKTLLRFTCLATLVLLLVSCYSTPLSVTKAPNNGTYDVAYLFEKDGYKVYRFYDMGSYVYFTTKNGSTMSVSADSAKAKIQVINPE
ncbi:MAG: DUF4884 domain-containing protein [Bacteroidales bacterium]